MLASVNIQKSLCRYNYTPFIVILIVGILLRTLVSFRGYNFDMESWHIVADIVRGGRNVYAETARYNYGPIWFCIINLLDALPGRFGEFEGLRWKVTIFLSLADIFIFTLLSRKYSIAIGTLFFLNPISIIISGYHNQFDNLAIALGIVGVYCYNKKKTDCVGYLPLAIIGISLAIKHVFFMFPIWLAFKENGWKKVIVTLIPFVVFFATFVPFLENGYHGIIENVVRYRSFDNAPLWSVITPYILYVSVPKILLFLVALFAFGMFLRKLNCVDSMWLYLISVVAFSSAIANQYLAICLPAIAIMWNRWFLLYTLCGFAFLLGNSDGLHFLFIQSLFGAVPSGYVLLIGILSIGLYSSVIPADKRVVVNGIVFSIPRWFVMKTFSQVKSLFNIV